MTDFVNLRMPREDWDELRIERDAKLIAEHIDTHLAEMVRIVARAELVDVGVPECVTTIRQRRPVGASADANINAVIEWISAAPLAALATEDHGVCGRCKRPLVLRPVCENATPFTNDDCPAPLLMVDTIPFPDVLLLLRVTARAKVAGGLPGYYRTVSKAHRALMASLTPEQQAEVKRDD